jgi:hypothetical protein
MTSFAVGDVVEVKWRPERPVKVDDRMYEAVVRLRSALIVAAQRRSTLTYAETATAIDELYPARGLGRALDLLSYDCGQRGEPSLAALVVRSDSGRAGSGWAGDAENEPRHLRSTSSPASLAAMKSCATAEAADNTRPS